MDVILDSTLRCPSCGAESAEVMQTDSCLFYWECPSCGDVARPKPGDCCVFCSYGTVACPPVQNGTTCCSTPSG